MEIYIGGTAQGKLKFVLTKLGEQAYELLDGEDVAKVFSEQENFGQGKVIIINHFHKLCKSFLEKGDSEEQLVTFIRQWNRKNRMILICDEVGNGVVPIDKKERDYREFVGRTLESLEPEADHLERIFCGVGQILKDTNRQITLIRHGKTPANAQKKYLGLTEESLSEEGIEELLALKEQGYYPVSNYCFVSPMKRCIETAKLLYPEAVLIQIPQWREMNFGIFEGKNYAQLNGNADYQAWVDSGCTIPIPCGESREAFINRCLEGYEKAKQLMAGIPFGEPIAMVVHGGTIMALESSFHEKDYFDYRIGCGEWVRL